MAARDNPLLAMARLRAMLRSGEARQLRKEAGLSLAETARRLGIGLSTLWRWEEGQRMPRDSDAALRYWDVLQQLRRRARKAVAS